jgi:hypothetical protein
VQIVAFAFKRRVCSLDNFNVEITWRTVTWPDFALSRQLDASAGINASGHFHRQRSARANPSIASTFWARCRYEVTKSTALWTRTRSHHLTKKRPLDGLDFAATLTHWAADTVASRRGTIPTTCAAADCRIHGDVANSPEHGLSQIDLQLDQRVLASPNPRTRPTRSTPAIVEEGIHDVAEAKSTLEPATLTTPRIASKVVHLSFRRVAEYLVRCGDFLEPLLCAGVRIDVRMKLTGEFAVRALDLLPCRIPRDAKHGVVVACHLSPFL